MAFPLTGILDTFDRADAATLGANWTDLTNGWAIASNQAAPEVNNVANWSLWSAAQFGPDCECFVDVPTKPTANARFVLLSIRSTTLVDSTLDGYEVYFLTASGNDTQHIDRRDNNVATQLGASITDEFNSGESLGIEMIGTTIALYNKVGGTWTQIATRTDATYTAAGYIGIQGNNTGTRLDNFGGGTIDTGLTVNVSETITLTDSAAITTSAPQVSAAETVTLTEAASIIISTAQVTASETITLTETATLAPLLLAGISVGETVTLIELATIAVVVAATLPNNAAYVRWRDKRAVVQG